MNATNTNAATFLTTGTGAWLTSDAKGLEVNVTELAEGTMAYDMLDADDFDAKELQDIADGPLYNISAGQTDPAFAKAWNEVIRSAATALQIRAGLCVTPGPRTSRNERAACFHGTARA